MCEFLETGKKFNRKNIFQRVNLYGPSGELTGKTT